MQCALLTWVCCCYCYLVQDLGNTKETSEDPILVTLTFFFLSRLVTLTLNPLIHPLTSNEIGCLILVAIYQLLILI